MKKKISIITSSRADFDQLFWLIKLIKESKKNELDLIVSGSHLIKEHGYTVNKIKKEKFKFKKIYLDINDDKILNTIGAISTGIKKFSSYFARSKPNYLILLGDRYEIFSAAISASFNNIPIIHLNGGELTQGSHDDWMRHCITKMSNIHFVANEVYKKRVIQLGEDPKNVFNTGGLSSDNVLKTKLIKKEKLQKLLKIKIKDNPKILITYHPESFNINYKKNSFLEIIKIIKYFRKISFFITFPNLDSGNKLIIKSIKKICLEQNNCKYFISLGRLKYLSLLSNCNLILGNSSSGILEAPYLGIRTINIGDRQEGRIRTVSVFDCKKKFEDIRNLINKLLLRKNNNNLINHKRHYGDGKSAERMIKIINSLNIKFNKKKFFFDL